MIHIRQPAPETEEVFVSVVADALVVLGIFFAAR
jgi:hypothetical protein